MTVRLRTPPTFAYAPQAAANEDHVLAPMPDHIETIRAAADEFVEADTLLVRLKTQRSFRPFPVRTGDDVDTFRSQSTLP
ncbi:MAG: hypothetical protein LBQ20_03765 [Rhodanobacter sp.]|nr:hypothetical protein [Rhodanobacter sp.]